MRLVDQSTRATIRTLTILAAAMSLLLTLITPFSGTAWAGHDAPYDATNAELDDETFTNLGDKCGNTNKDDQAKGGTKLDTIHDDDAPVIVESSMTPKDDFCEFWVDYAIDEHGDVWLYAAFTRYATNGTAHIAIELMDSGADCNVTDYANCNPWENRTDGTRIVGFTWHGNSGKSTPEITAPTLWSFDAVTGFDAGSPLGAAFTGSTNSTGSFGEIAVNLSEAGDPPIIPNANETDECELITAVIPMSIPGYDLGSQLKDVVLGTVPPIQNCGSLEVIKKVTGGNAFGDTFPITVSDGTTDIKTDNLGHNGSFPVDELQEGAYTVSENLSGLPGWSIDSIVCVNEDEDIVAQSGDGVTSLSNVPVEAGETTTCTVTNTPDLPDLTIIKQVINDNGGEMEADEFPVRNNGSLVSLTDETPDGDYDSQASWSGSVNPGTYTIAEDAVTGYTLESIICVGNGVDSEDAAKVTLGLGDDATCTVINDDEPGELILIKDIDDEDDLYPNVTEDDFTPTIGGDDADWGSNPVDAGTYTVDEDDTVGPLSDGTFVQTKIVCDGLETDQVTIGNGETKSCTITNMAVGAGLTVIKDVQNNWGGDLTASDFPLTVNGDTVTSGVAATFPAGTYTIAETQQDDYELADTYCTRNGVDVDGISGESFDITVAPDQTVVCTFVNRDLPGSLTINKTVTNDDGGTLTQADFTPTLDGDNTTWGSQNETKNGQTGIAWGTHTIGEDDLPAGYTMTDIDCGNYGNLEEGDDTVDVTIGAGDNVVCTITNDDLPGSLTVTKVAQNNWGGQLGPNNFGLTVDGSSVTSGVSMEVDADTYTIAETQPTGYEFVSSACTRDGAPVDGISGSSFDVAVGLGETVACTLVNRDLPGSLTINKTVTNDDGGTLTQAAFTPTLDGDNTTWGSQNETKNGQTGIAWGTYTIGEDDLPAGYTMTDIDCGNYGNLEEGDDTVDVTIGAGDNVVCTITNDDLPGTLTLVKAFSDHAGGTATQADFQPVVNNETDLDWGTHTVDAGSYTVGEADRAPSAYLVNGKYVLVSIDCGNDTDTVIIPNGGSATCTVTNAGVPAGLTVVKQVQNNWGGQLSAASFPLTINDDTVISGEPVTRPAGDYTITEVQQDGYQLVSTSCLRDGEPVVGISGESFSISVDLDETVVCTFVNRDVPGSLTILKDVVNDDGGTATQADFTPMLDGDGTDWGSQNETKNGQTGIAWGTHTIGEDDLPAGYVMTDIDCGTFGSLADDESTVEVTIGAGDAVVCTITNDDQPATLTLVKTVINNDGGTLEADDFPVFVNDDEVAWETELSIPAGEHTVSEEQQPGYLSALGWGGDCAADGTLNAEVGGEYVCTITNDDLPAGLTIVKEVLIGDLVPEDFPLLITDGDGVTQTVSSGQVTTLPAGTYTIGEEQQDGYELVDIECDNGVVLADDEETVTVTVGLDETVVCTISNAEVRVLPIVVEPEPLPATGLYTMRLALLSALFAALGALLLVGTRTAPATGRRRRD